jgi:demethylmenaquinone methyltransferase/2-methoxy-6-polyprenyl-1,4-benzoquinol methylase
MVVGIDPADGMLEIGRKKIEQANLSEHVSFKVADGSALPFEESSFSGTVSAFTIRNIADRDQAMREMHRVLLPGGRAAILELTTPANRLMRVMHRLYNRSVVPVVGRLLSHGDAYDYLIRSIDDFPSPASVVEGLTPAGFEAVAATPLSGGVVTLFTGTRPA